MTKGSPKKEFKCYLCDEMKENKNIGGSIGNNLIPREIICDKCVHDNYCWATDKDISHASYTISTDNFSSIIRNY